MHSHDSWTMRRRNWLAWPKPCQRLRPNSERMQRLWEWAKKRESLITAWSSLASKPVPNLLVSVGDIEQARKAKAVADADLKVLTDARMKAGEALAEAVKGLELPVPAVVTEIQSANTSAQAALRRAYLDALYRVIETKAKDASQLKTKADAEADAAKTNEYLESALMDQKVAAALVEEQERWPR